MEQKALLQFLSDAIELETAVTQQEQFIAEYNAISLSRKPIQKIDKNPEYPQLTDWTLSKQTESALILIGNIFFSLPIFSIGPLIDKRYETGIPLIVIGCLGMFCIIAGILIHKKKHTNKQNEKLDEYNLVCSMITTRNEKYAREYRYQLSAWKSANAEMLAYMQKPLDETKELLKKYYASSDIIYPKYRSLPALTSIYEYLITGRCSELSGPYGAYNLYEDEVRKDTVISQLNAALENLEQIKQNQYMLYQQVSAIRETTTVIVSELRQIKHFSAETAAFTKLNAYYAALNERNTRYAVYQNM